MIGQSAQASADGASISTSGTSRVPSLMTMFNVMVKGDRSTLSTAYSQFLQFEIFWYFVFAFLSARYPARVAVFWLHTHYHAIWMQVFFLGILVNRARIVFTNENEFIIRHIDDAKIKRAETDQSVQLKKMEIIEKRRADAASAKRIKIIVSLIMGILCVLFLSFPKTNGMVIVGLSMPVCIMLIWTIGLVNREGDDIYIGDKIKVPRSISNFEEKTYPTIETCLSDAGFTNINCVPLNDLKVGLVHRPGAVESITINGIKIESGGRSFPSDSIIVISYHSIPK